MLVHAKLLDNGPEGAVWEIFSLNFKFWNNFDYFHWFEPKVFVGMKSPEGCSVIKKFLGAGGATRDGFNVASAGCPQYSAHTTKPDPQ